MFYKLDFKSITKHSITYRHFFLSESAFQKIIIASLIVSGILIRFLLITFDMSTNCLFHNDIFIQRYTKEFYDAMDGYDGRLTRFKYSNFCTFLKVNLCALWEDKN